MYNYLSCRQNCSLWIPVTPVSKASCLKYVGGSHKWGKWFTPINFASLNNYKYTDPNIKNTDKVFENIPDIDAHPEKYQLFAWDLEVLTNLKQGDENTVH